jgi:alpha-N-arabinofuranosidase
MTTAGVFHNPILKGFYPDPSICRVENDFYLVNSTFAYFPGIPVFHSRDLSHWKQIGNVIHRPGQIDFDGAGISRGLFAPTIRYNKGVFYVLCTLIDKGGNFIVTAGNPAGPWSDPLWLPDAPGIDPSIFFDEDGSIWYTGNRPAIEGQRYPGNYEIWIQEIDPALLAAGQNPLTGKSLAIWQGALRDCIWPEGPHIYKINGWYYLLHAEGGTSVNHAVCVARAQNIRGPWEGKPGNPVLTHRHLGKNAAIINVGHADLFDDPLGNWWMAALGSRPFKGVCPLGRETFMVPVRWEEGWPYVDSKTGLIENEFSLPVLPGQAADLLEAPPESACDHFDSDPVTIAHNVAHNGTGLPPGWLTLRMPQKAEDAAISLSARPGCLRLFTKAADMRGTGHPAFAGRRLRHKDWLFQAAFTFQPKTEEEAAGIVLLQNEDFQYRFELCLVNSRLSLRLAQAAGKTPEVTTAWGAAECGGEQADGHFVLAAHCNDMEIVFSFGKDQYSLKPRARVDGTILSTEHAGGFVGTVAGVFATGGGKDNPNYADVSWAEYSPL